MCGPRGQALSSWRGSRSRKVGLLLFCFSAFGFPVFPEALAHVEITQMSVTDRVVCRLLGPPGGQPSQSSFWKSAPGLPDPGEPGLARARGQGRLHPQAVEPTSLLFGPELQGAQAGRRWQLGDPCPSTAGTRDSEGASVQYPPLTSNSRPRATHSLDA